MAVILLLEDDRILSHGICIALEKSGHTVIAAHSYHEAAEAYKKHSFDLFLLDINLPDGDGMAFCRRLREESEQPIVFLTAKDTEAEMLEGFAAGCDDYIPKPFSIEVLRQKIQVLLKRASAASVREDSQAAYKGLDINFERMTVRKNGKDIHLTATEYKLLEYLFRNRGRVLTRNMLLEQLWDAEGNFIDENTLSVHVGRLRRKLETNPREPEYIITVFGIGYTFGEEA